MVRFLWLIQSKTNETCFCLGNQAANNFRNAADEAKNRSGYGQSGNRPPSPSSSSGQPTTDKIKDKASEFAQQAKSTVRKFW